MYTYSMKALVLALLPTRLDSAELSTCAALEESQEDQASLGFKGTGGFSLPPVLPLLRVDRLERREPRFVLPMLSLCTDNTSEAGLGKEEKPGGKS